MFTDVIRKSELAGKFLKVIIILIILVALFFYFKLFYTKGIIYDDTFLKKEGTSIGVQYTGKSEYGDGNLYISVIGNRNKDNTAEVIYKLPNNIYKEYTVEYIDSKNWDSGIKKITDANGAIIFEGVYNKDSYFLLDKGGKPIIDVEMQFVTSGGSIYNKDYKIPLISIAELACFYSDTIRGNYAFLIMAIVILIITVIDIKFPLFFFTLRNFLAVRNPEPSDLYLIIQKISWYVYPVIILFLMFIAINYD